MAARLASANSESLASTVAPEDVRCGDYIALLNEIVELPSFMWCDGSGSTPEDLIRIRCCAADAGLPLKVKAVCLPFVFVKQPDGQFRTVDVRQVQLVRLSADYARSVWKALRNEQSRTHVQPTDS